MFVQFRLLAPSTRCEGVQRNPPACPLVCRLQLRVSCLCLCKRPPLRAFLERLLALLADAVAFRVVLIDYLLLRIMPLTQPFDHCARLAQHLRPLRVRGQLQRVLQHICRFAPRKVVPIVVRLVRFAGVKKHTIQPPPPARVTGMPLGQLLEALSGLLGVSMLQKDLARLIKLLLLAVLEDHFVRRDVVVADRLFHDERRAAEGAHRSILRRIQRQRRAAAGAFRGYKGHINRLPFRLLSKPF